MYKMFALGMTLVLLAACSPSDAPSPETPSPAKSGPSVTLPTADFAAVRSLVERFGRQMRKVSTLAPPEAMHEQLQSVYGQLLSPALLEEWQAHPGRVVGREVSSPWPQRIEIGQVDCAREDACRVMGRVDYVTSNELAQGGVFMRRDIALKVARDGRGWRITAADLASARQAEDDAAR